MYKAKYPGEYTVRMDVPDLPAGVYLVRLQAGLEFGLCLELGSWDLEFTLPVAKIAYFCTKNLSHGPAIRIQGSGGQFGGNTVQEYRDP